MSWFHRLCRQSGLMVHHVARSVKSPPGPPRHAPRGPTHEVRRETRETRPEPGMTLRRTVIEEVELHRDTKQNSDPGSDSRPDGDR